MPEKSVPSHDKRDDAKITERERRFLKRLAQKYDHPGCPLVKSIAIFTAMIGAAHAVERTALPGWAAFLLVYLPALGMFGLYRKFGIFKARLMCKLARQAEQTAESDTPPNGTVENVRVGA